MEIEVPFRVEYKTKEPVPIPEIIDSLRSLQVVLEESGRNLENLLPGVSVESINVRVQEISHGSLRELLVIGIFLAFQDDLEREVPELIEKLTGANVPEEFNMLVSLVALVSLIYGAAFVKDLLADGIKDTPIRKKQKALINDIAKRTGKSSSEVKSLLDERYKPKNRIKQLADSAVKFFKPSKSQSNAPIEFGNEKLPSELVQDAPEDYVYEEAAKMVTANEYPAVELELHAQDKDRGKTGWAAIPIGYSKRRLPMKLVDNLSPEDLWGKDRVTADIVLKSKREGLDFVPSEIHVQRIIA